MPMPEPLAAAPPPPPSRAEKRYAAKPKGAIKEGDVGGYIDKMDEVETQNYDALRKKGFSTDESVYHATNPPGRVAPSGMKDPWGDN